MSLVEGVYHLTFLVALLALLTWHMRDRRSPRPGILFAGITGHEPLLAGIPVRDVRGMNKRPAVVCASIGNKTC